MIANYLTSLLLFIIAYSTLEIHAQIEDGSLPYSFQTSAYFKTNVVRFPALNKDSLAILDAQEALEGKVFRFGVELPYTSSFYEVAAVKVMPDKSLLWTLVIEADEALSLNFNFSYFRLQKGTQLWAYSFNKKQVYGAFTYRNHNPDGNFAIAPIQSNKVVLELYEPAENAKTSDIIFQGVVYGYRSLYGDKQDKEIFGFNDAGNCNININCSEAVNWHRERDAVVMLLTAGNTRKCSGTFINNTSVDAKPYVLTANHCNTLPNAIIMFNYQSPDCSNVNGPTGMTMQGCDIVAKNAVTDFALLRFNQTPLPNYNTFYAGWTRDTTNIVSGVGIHHPRGDIKKYSKTTETILPAHYLNPVFTPGASHWRVPRWTSGVTEGGSSGSALFNSNRQIIGQLHGGYASCSQLQNPDYYGRFDYSWNQFSDSTLQLKHWLDPTNLNPSSFAGTYHYSPFYDEDVSLKLLYKPNGNYCQDALTIPFELVNLSKNQVLEIKIEILRNQEHYDFITWLGNSSFLDTLHLSYSISSLIDGVNAFEFVVVAVNGVPDERPADNQDGFSIIKTEGSPLYVRVDAQYASLGDTIFVKNTQGAIVSKITDFKAGENLKEVCITPNCYVVYWNNTSQNLSNLALLDTQNTVLETAFQMEIDDSVVFCTPDNTLDYDLFTIYPVPNDGQFTLQINPSIINEPLLVKISDISGRIIYMQAIQNAYITSVQVDLASGVYIVFVRSEKLKRTFKKKILVY